MTLLKMLLNALVYKIYSIPQNIYIHVNLIIGTNWTFNQFHIMKNGWPIMSSTGNITWLIAVKHRATTHSGTV